MRWSTSGTLCWSQHFYVYMVSTCIYLCVCCWSTHLRQLYTNCAAPIQLIGISTNFSVDIKTVECMNRIFICSRLKISVWDLMYISIHIYIRIYFSVYYMTSTNFIAETFYILLHTSSLMSQLHSTNKCHYVLVFAHALHLSSCTVL